jgi:glycerophosphoryl diester phosphodiesterase
MQANQIPWIHGHRGCRALMPENTIPAFCHAILLGADAIELDVVMSAAGDVVVSHEPYMAASKVLKPSGERISRKEQKKMNIYEMYTEEITAYDCGSLRNKDFPKQKTMKAHKPLLVDVFHTVEFLCRDQKRKTLYNIEIKSRNQDYGSYQPYPAEFCRCVLNTIYESGLQDQVMIQSFDRNILRELRMANPHIPLGILVEDMKPPIKHLNALGFIPEYYNPLHKALDKKLMKLSQSLSFKVIPWTINDVRTMNKAFKLGVAGIITDDPAKALMTRNKFMQSHEKK